MKIPATVALALSVTITPAISEEWWHGGFVPEGIDCPKDIKSTDAYSIYTATGIEGWEWYCTIEETVTIRGMDAVLLDLRCGYPDDTEITFRRELLVSLKTESGGSAGMVVFPGDQRLKRCEVAQ